MRFKRATTIALACVATVCTAIGTVAYIKSEAEQSLEPQPSVSITMGTKRISSARRNPSLDTAKTTIRT